MNISCWSDYMTWNVHDGGMDEEDLVPIYNDILHRHKKNKIPFAVTWARDCHTEWSKSDRKRQIYDIAYTWILKKKNGTNESVYLQNRSRATDAEIKLKVTRGKASRDKLEDWDWHIHITIFKIDNNSGPTL